MEGRGAAVEALRGRVRVRGGDEEDKGRGKRGWTVVKEEEEK